MARCPKCGYKFKLTDLKPDCPKCGVNVVYYGMEEQLLDDADKAEAEHARFQKRFDRLKASFIGSKLTIVRIVLSILPLAPLFLLPLAKVSFSGPFFGAEKYADVAINGIKLIDFVPNLNFDSLLGVLGSSIVGKPFIMFAVSLVTLLLSIVLILVSLILLIMACGKHGNSRNITLNSIMIVLTVISIITFGQFAKGLGSVFDVFSGSIQYGAFVYLATLIALLAINIIIAKKGVEVKYKQTYIGGLPSEEYFELVEAGTDITEIRQKMAVALAIKDKADKDEKARKEAEAEAKKIAEMEKKAAAAKGKK